MRIDRRYPVPSVDAIPRASAIAPATRESGERSRTRQPLQREWALPPTTRAWSRWNAPDLPLGSLVDEYV